MIAILTYDIEGHTHKIESIGDFNKRAGFCEKFYYYTGLQNINEMKKVTKVLQARLKDFEDEKRDVEKQPHDSLEVLREQYYQVYETWPKNLTGKSEIESLNQSIATNDLHLVLAQGSLNCLGRKICQFVQKIFGWMKSKWKKQLVDVNSKIDEGLKDVRRELEIGKATLFSDPVSARAELLTDKDEALSGDMKISLIVNPASSQWVNVGYMIVKQEKKEDLTVEIADGSSSEVNALLLQIAKEMCLQDGLKGIVDNQGNRLEASTFGKITDPILV